MVNAKEIHKKIRKTRKLKQWSQEEMAEKLGMSINGYAKIERGETCVIHQNLQRIVGILGLTLADLFKDEDTREHQNIRTY